MNIVIKTLYMASKQQIIEAANDSARQLGYEKLKDLQLEVVIGIVSGQDVFAIFPRELAVFDTCKTLDSSFHKEITLSWGSDRPCTSPSRLLFFTQEDKSLPHTQQYIMITRICGTCDHTCKTVNYILAEWI